jgi:hypothetical protein
MAANSDQIAPNHTIAEQPNGDRLTADGLKVDQRWLDAEAELGKMVKLRRALETFSVSGQAGSAPSYIAPGAEGVAMWGGLESLGDAAVVGQLLRNAQSDLLERSQRHQTEDSEDIGG